MKILGLKLEHVLLAGAVAFGGLYAFKKLGGNVKQTAGEFGGAIADVGAGFVGGVGQTAIDTGRGLAGNVGVGAFDFLQPILNPVAQNLSATLPNGQEIRATFPLGTPQSVSDAYFISKGVTPAVAQVKQTLSVAQSKAVNNFFNPKQSLTTQNKVASALGLKVNQINPKVNAKPSNVQYVKNGLGQLVRNDAYKGK